MSSGVGGGRKTVAFNPTDPVVILLNRIERERLPVPVREHYFAKPRRWRFDLAYPERMLAVEVDGGVYTQGRHTRGKGYEDDAVKLNAAALQGWLVLRFTPRLIRSGYAVEMIRMALHPDLRQIFPKPAPTGQEG